MARESEEENHWPGYVDALTTMTMMLVFVMMILAVALFSISQNASRSLVERIADAAGIPTEGRQVDIDAMARQVAVIVGNQRTRQPPQNMPAELTSPVEGQERIIHSGEAEKTFVARGQVATQKAESVLTLTFPPRGTVVDDNAGGEIVSYVEQLRGKAAHYHIRAMASLELGNASDARRLAFYRALAVRTRMVAGGIPAQNIHVRVVDIREGVAAERVEIRAQPGAPAQAPSTEGR